MSQQPYEPVVPGALDEINLLDQSLQNCPYHAYQLLRDEAPVWKDPITGFYVISRFHDLRDLLLDPEHYSNDMRGGQGGSRERLDAERMAGSHTTRENIVLHPSKDNGRECFSRLCCLHLVWLQLVPFGFFSARRRQEAQKATIRAVF